MMDWLHFAYHHLHDLKSGPGGPAACWAIETCCGREEPMRHP